MNLPEFITKAVEFFGFAQAKLETLPDTATAQARILELETQNNQLSADLTTARQTIGTLEVQVKTLEASGAVKDAEIAKFNSTLDAKVAEKAAQITASQGQPPLAAVPPKDKPAAEQQLTLTERFIAKYRNKH